MSVLSKKSILKLVREGKLIFSPGLDGFQVQPHAIDLRLGYTFHLPKTWHITEKGREIISVDPLENMNNGDLFEKVELKDGQFFELMPKEFVIAVTLEKISINCDDLMAVLYPRSSINRRGLSVDLSGIIDVWYEGHLMIPIVNNTETQPIRLYPGERFCQIVFETLSDPIDKETATNHGLSKAKYIDADNNEFVACKMDKRDEIELLKKGELGEIKKKYQVASSK